MSELHKISQNQPSACRADVIFLHGLGGDPFATWRHGKDEGSSWPHWLAGEFPDVGVWSLEYPASPSSRFRWLRRAIRGFSRESRSIGHAIPLTDRAGQVLDLMVQRGLGERPLLLIGHSLGGLLTKQILRKARDSSEPRKQKFYTHTEAVLFLATPHTGSPLASRIDSFRTILGATANIEDLRAHDAHLRDLYDWYRNQSGAIETRTYFEGMDTAGARIVDESSSHPGVGHDPIKLDEDHISISKPLQHDAQVCHAARDLLNDLLNGSTPKTPDALEANSDTARSEESPAQHGHPEGWTPVVDLTHLPAGASHFLGREAELGLLDRAWDSEKKTAIVELIAAGGTGKTALLKRWLDRMRAEGWRGARRVFGWSFYSQGTSEDRQASEDGFLAEALAFFEVAHEPSLNPVDKGRLLGQAVAASRCLLLLDGVEPLQYPPGPLEGELKGPGLKALLSHLASAGQPGLLVLTSRERIEELVEYERGQSADLTGFQNLSGLSPQGSVLRHDLGNLSDADGAHLLWQLGARRAGAAAIPAEAAASDDELRAASREVQGHALTLSLLGGYLALAFEGDIRRRDQVNFAEADAELRGGHAFRVMAAYEQWFKQAGEQGARELALLRLLGLFDRPASPASLDALRAAPPIPGLTEPLVGLTDAQWCTTLTRLTHCGLLYPQTEADATGEEPPLDAHPLVREYLAERLRNHQTEAWREGHRRIYAQLKASCPHRPEGLPALQPLYQAVAHGCLAGLHEEARAEVYRDRILRGTGNDGFYSWRKLGAFGANLGAVACLFAEPWRRPAPTLAEGAQAWLLNHAAFALRALGRLGEALEPMRAGAEMLVKQENWKSAATSYSNLSELQLTLGRVEAARGDAERALEHAERSGEWAQRMGKRTTLADALHQQGEAAALGHFVEAEALQAQRQADYPLLYSLPGFRYCDLLLAGAERLAWQLGVDASASASSPKAGLQQALDDCDSVAQRAAQTLKIATDNNLSLLTIALDHLTLARCALYRALLQGESAEAARSECRLALDGLLASGDQDIIPLALLTRAWLHHALGELPKAAADLAEVQRIASRGGMRLFLADYHLYHARLFSDPEHNPRHHLSEARRLIEECGYGRRLPELEFLEGLVERRGAPGEA